MKFKSQIFTETSGSVGGLTFAHNRGGLYSRARSIPTDPATALQTAIRNHMASLSARWRATLTAAERAAWDAYALATPLLDSLGEPRNVGGVGMYQRGNVPVLISGVAEGVVDAGPVTNGLPALNTVTPTVTAPSSISVAFDDTQSWVNEDGAVLMIYASRPQNASINFFKGPYQFAGGIEGDAALPPTSPTVVTSPFVYVAGNRVFVRAVLVRADARLSLSQFTQDDV